MITRSYKYQVAYFVAFVLFFGFAFLPLFVNKDKFVALISGNSIFRYLAAAYLFVAAILFFWGVLRFRGGSWLLRLSQLVIALLLIIFAGVAINWGAGMFGLAANQSFNPINFIPVTGVKPIGFFQGITADQALAVFVLTIALVIPLIAWIFPSLGKRIGSVLPILPLGAGVLVLIAFLIQNWGLRALTLLPPPYQAPNLTSDQIDEIGRHAYAFTLLVSAIVYFMKKMDEIKKEHEEALLRALTYTRR